MSGFPAILLQRLDAAKEVDIETRSASGDVHRVTIWVVVHDGARRVAVRPVAVRSTEIIDLVSGALWKKYGRSASLFSMLRLAVLDTTLRLEPT